MNRYSALACLGLGLMVSPVLSGLAGSAVPSNPKIGVIDFDSTLRDTPAGKRASDAFEKTRKGKQDELDREQDQLKKADADLQKQAAVLKPDVLQAKKEELQKQFVALQQTYMKLERDLADERAKLTEGLLKTASPKIEALAKAEGVSVILDRAGLLYADAALDLTPKLNAEMR